MGLIRFAKMAGAGNDFAVLDNREEQFSRIEPEWIRRLCTPRFAVGADGVLLLSRSQEADYAMRYFNADGSEASMCGNGARCLARFAVLQGIGQEGKLLSFTTAAGTYQALVFGSRVQLTLPPPVRFEQDIALSLETGERLADFMDTGVPQAVLFTKKVKTEAVDRLGREIRFHPRFQPAGTNVNFCQVLDQQHLRIRTYERGVEGETLACGTGAAAAALLAARRGWVQSPVWVMTRSGMELEMEFTPSPEGFSAVRQTGEARLVYWGELTEEALTFPLPLNPPAGSGYFD